jgi:hypothetical protein
MLKRFFLLLTMLLILLPQSLLAQDTPCDPEYFKSLKSRAWLEAQREITQNQNLIFKPDSVFEYTCFDLHLNELADHAKDMFSETERWGTIPKVIKDADGEPISMDNALEGLVGKGLRTYIRQNFEETGEGTGKSTVTYDLLGGRLDEVLNPASGDINRNIDYEVNDHINNPNDYEHKIDGRDEPDEGERRNFYDCDIMNQVWMAAKCMDFIDNATNDGFFTFEEYGEYADDDKDHRFLPRMCEAVARWNPEIAAAYADESQTPWEEDDIDVFYSAFEPTADCNTSKTLQTGLKIFVGGDEYAETVCLKDGCYWAIPDKKCVANP